MKNFILFLLLCLGFSAFGQRRLDPTSQFEKAPGNNPGFIMLSNSDGKYDHIDFNLAGNGNTTLVFAPDGDVDPDSACSPSLQEIMDWNNGLGSPNSDALIYYNCTNDEDETSTFVYYVNENGDVILVESPQAEFSLQRRIIPSPAFATAEAPTEAEVRTYMLNLSPAPKPGTIFYQVSGAIPMYQTANNPATCWLYDGVNITRIKDFPRKVEIPDNAFADTLEQTVAEVYAWLGVDTTYAGNYWLLYNIGAGTRENPDWIYSINGDYSVSNDDIVCLKKPSNGMFSAANQGGTWAVTDFTVASPTIQRIADNTASILQVREGTKPYLDFTTTNGAEAVTVFGSGVPGIAGSLFRSNATTFYNVGAWRQGLQTFALTTDYTLLDSDVFLDLTNSSGTTKSIILPASPASGRTLFISYRSGTVRISVDGNGKTINGSATYPLDSVYQSVMLIYNATEWRAFAFNNGDSELDYPITVSGANAGAGLRVRATGPGVTCAFSGSQYTVTIPTGVKLISAHFVAVAADVTAASDGAVTNWLRFRFVGTEGNNGISTLRVPVPQKVTVPPVAGGVTLSLTNSAAIDVDNNPAWSVVAAGSNAITIRMNGASFADQGFGVGFTGF